MTSERPRGRRPQGADARGDILRAARDAFVDKGFAASMREIARRAGVDAALVHHYFADKSTLFLESIFAAATPPLGADGPAGAARAFADGPRDEVGERIVLRFVTLWDSMDGARTFRLIAHGLLADSAAMAPLRQFFIERLFGPLARQLGSDQPELRAQLVGTQIVGLGMLRYVIKAPDLAVMAPDAVARAIGPTITRYLTEPL